MGPARGTGLESCQREAKSHSSASGLPRRGEKPRTTKTSGASRGSGSRVIQGMEGSSAEAVARHQDTEQLHLKGYGV